ncbi:MAG: bifunctional 4-hydroxy-2-oxoglutarate aldolase/2-dehydro-3-deoxy-phosphogluconate aldolase [Terriglobales bacterium]
MSWTRDQALRLIHDVGIIPIVRTSSTEDALCAAEAIIASGVGIVEVTMTVPNALSIIEQVTKRFGDRVVAGAGTVLDKENCEMAIAAGADFVVTPSFDPHVIETTRKHGKACIPGALTPTEVLAAWRAGADLVKVFPCGPVGGPKYIKALKAPFGQIDLVPTGGVSLDNAADFIRAGASAVAVGAELVDLKALREGNLEVITSKAKRFIQAVRMARDSSREGNANTEYALRVDSDC